MALNLHMHAQISIDIDTKFIKSDRQTIYNLRNNITLYCRSSLKLYFIIDKYNFKGLLIVQKHSKKLILFKKKSVILEHSVIIYFLNMEISYGWKQRHHNSISEI